MGGRLSFQASVPTGGDANVSFKFESAPFPDNDLSFSTETVTVSGSEP